MAGFGTFEARFVNERNIHNPQTGGKLAIPGHFLPKFKPGKALKEKIEQK
ncbi:MAG: HU family DNA-binding protein [[Clostridium] innocuum]